MFALSTVMDKYLRFESMRDDNPSILLTSGESTAYQLACPYSYSNLRYQYYILIVFPFFNMCSNQQFPFIAYQKLHKQVRWLCPS